MLTKTVKWVNILSMNSNFLNQKTPNEIARNLAEKSGVSLGSIKRFETKYEISLQSLIKIAIALNLDSDFEKLFSTKTYISIDEVING